MEKKLELAVGDECWFLTGVSLYDVVISEVRRILEGEPDTFTMYRVRSSEGLNSYYERDVQHRSDLFKKTSERGLLIEQLESDREGTDYLLRQMRQEQDDEEDRAQSPAETSYAQAAGRGERQSPADVQAQHLGEFGKS